MTEKPEDKIVRLMRDSTTGRLKPDSANSINVNGNGNLVAGGDMHFHAASAKAERPKIVVQTGVGVIDAKQKADIQKKLTQWLTARNAIRRDKMSIPAAWKAMNEAVGVNSYHEMTPDQYKTGLAWLARQRAILRSMTSAPLKDGGFRNDMISAIKARSKELGDLNYYRPHITQTYEISSLTGLNDRQLQEVRAWIMKQRRR